MPHVNLNMRPIGGLPLNNEYTPSSKSRDKWNFEDNQSPSVRDAVFQNEREEKIAQAKTKKEAEAVLTVEIKTAEKAALLTDECGRMTISREAIGDHLEERISAFLMQIIDCYDTNKYFTIGKTQDQTKSTSAIHFKVEQGIPVPPQASLQMTFASAHHGTLPCIFAYPRNEWEVWKAKNDAKAAGKPIASVYMNKSDTYYLNNACTGLATVINQADIDLDGNATEAIVEFGAKKTDAQKKLREFTIELLNRAARKEINPIQGFGLFLAKLTILLDQLKKQNPTGEKNKIFSAWQEDLENLTEKYQGNHKLLIAELLHIRISTQNRDTFNLEQIIYPRHFDLLKTKNLYKTELSYRIDQLKEKILETAGKTPKNFDKAFKLVLLEEASQQSEKIRTIFQRYYNCSGQTKENLKRECEQSYKPALRLVNTVNAKKEVKDFFRIFAQYIHNLKIEESKFSCGLVREIRQMQGLSLRSFAKKFNATFPQAHPLNYGQLYRIELGCVQPTTTMIKQLASVLNIHKSVLSPGLIT